MFIPVKMRDQIQRCQNVCQILTDVTNCTQKACFRNLNEKLVSNLREASKLLSEEFNNLEQSISSSFHDFYDGTNVKVNGIDKCITINSDCKMHIGPEGLVLDFFPEPEHLVSAGVKDVTVMD